ncbi:glycosyltransferase family 2 protein [candidate division WOR-3 bacterium]|nr:glycosyltransferase family 2 protein [candidate division WOR-3 bacterium]
MSKSLTLEILIITWNCLSDLRRCLNSIFNYPPKDSFKVTVIDNGSVDNTVELIKKDFSQVNLIQNIKNRGVAPARNQGLAITEAEFVMILDADTEVFPKSLQKLIKAIRARPQAGIVGAQLLYPDGSIQPSCKRIPHLIAPILNRMTNLPGVKKTTIWRHHMMEDWTHDKSLPVDYVIGANQLIRTKALREVGLLDENIFYGPEDVDFCVRMWQKGWEVWYISQIRIIHHCARLTKRNPFSRLARLHLYGLLYFFRKFRPEERRRIRRLVERSVEFYSNQP